VSPQRETLVLHHVVKLELAVMPGMSVYRYRFLCLSGSATNRAMSPGLNWWSPRVLANKSRLVRKVKSSKVRRN
jgi:hypothetical protein